MSLYTAENTLVLAKRFHNTKRTYLLINPLQAKHLPVSPSKALKMMSCLGERLAEKYSGAKLVIGFAETATAIAAEAAFCLNKECHYIHTTREQYPDISQWIYFNEEHSHAVEQKLYCKDLATLISQTSQIILIDDEISTGKTLINIVEQIREKFPQAKDKQIVAASVINRLSEENLRRFSRYGIESEYLVKIEDRNLTDCVAGFRISSAPFVKGEENDFESECIFTEKPLMNPRFCVNISEYKAECEASAACLCREILKLIPKNANILVLGTEECMYPSLILGQVLECCDRVTSVRCHSTTRSPIGVCSDKCYPVNSGFKLGSLYDSQRETYIYNLTKYDAAIILTDSSSDNLQGKADLTKVLKLSGCSKVIFAEGNHCV